jgi:hypothetical protein
MAKAKILETHHLEQVRAQVGAFLNTHPNPALAKGATFIEESFEIWMLPTERILSPDFGGRVISDFLVRTGRWHHQISQNGRAVGFALSGASDRFRPGWGLHAVFASPLASKIGKAIERIDRDRADEDVEAFYVSVPAFRIVCFVLRSYSSEEVFIVRSTNAAGAPQEGRFYSAREFCDILSRMKRVKGAVVA